jgi:ASPIC and UnbV/FG-GAP-like repeat
MASTRASRSRPLSVWSFGIRGVVLGSLVLGLPAQAPVFAFQDVSAAVGIVDRGLSFGVSVGDVNGDGWPDVFSGGHYSAHPRLWINDKGTGFFDVAGYLVPPPAGDVHGAQWADFDSDGKQELIVLRGANYGLGAAPKHVYVQIAGSFVDVAGSIGLAVPPMRARTPLAVDYDRDGQLDVFLTSLLRPDQQFPPSLYRQNNGVFSDVGGMQPLLWSVGTEFGVLGDLDGDRALDVVFDGAPMRAFAIGPSGLTNITQALGLLPLTWVQDCVVADLTGDGENELYVARDARRSSCHRDGPQTVEFRAITSGQEHGVRFAVPPGSYLWFDWASTAFPATSVFVGAQGLPPAANGTLLDPMAPANQGIAPHTPGVALGVYVGFDAAAGEWVMRVSTPQWSDLMLRGICTHPVGVPAPVGFNPTPGQTSDRLFTRSNGQLVDITAAAGIPASLRGRSVVAADFDNDMDLDLYVLTTTDSQNTANVLLENRGKGAFVPVSAGVAAGSGDGIGDCVASLDYDRDGRVDLFLVNGGGSLYRQNGSPGAFADDGPAQLLRNVTSNANQWLAIDLVGTASNRDGIGARIEVVAGGVTQVREHGGGMHRYSQNHGIHFGLGANLVANTVTVRWPSGAVSVRTNVAAGQFLQIVE